MRALFLTLMCFWIVQVQATKSYTDKPQYWALMIRLEQLEDQYKFIEKIWSLKSASIKLDNPFDKIFMVEPSAFENSSRVLSGWQSPFERHLTAWEIYAP